MRAFADALDSVPMALAENSGLSPIETLANIKSRQAKEGNTRLGVDCMQTGSNGEYTVSYPLHLFHTLSILARVPLSLVSDRHYQHILFPLNAAVLSCTPTAHLRNRVVARSRGADLDPRPPPPRDVALYPHATPTYCGQRCNHERRLDGLQEQHCFAVTPVTCVV
jgi:hypothetical protein